MSKWPILFWEDPTLSKYWISCLHRLWYLLSLTIRNYTLLLKFTWNVSFTMWSELCSLMSKQYIRQPLLVKSKIYDNMLLAWRNHKIMSVINYHKHVPFWKIPYPSPQPCFGSYIVCNKKIRYIGIVQSKWVPRGIFLWVRISMKVHVSFHKMNNLAPIWFKGS